MKKLILDIINKLDTPEITFADVRFTNTDTQTIYFEKGILKHYGSNMESKALGIRVLINGCWGFAGTKILSKKSIDATIKKAIYNASTGSKFRREPAEYKQWMMLKKSNIMTILPENLPAMTRSFIHTFIPNSIVNINSMPTQTGHWLIHLFMTHYLQCMFWHQMEKRRCVVPGRAI